MCMQHENPQIEDAKLNQDHHTYGDWVNIRHCNAQALYSFKEQRTLIWFHLQSSTLNHCATQVKGNERRHYTASNKKHRQLHCDSSKQTFPFSRLHDPSADKVVRGHRFISREAWQQVRSGRGKDESRGRSDSLPTRTFWKCAGWWPAVIRY